MRRCLQRAIRTRRATARAAVVDIQTTHGSTRCTMASRRCSRAGRTSPTTSRTRCAILGTEGAAVRIVRRAVRIARSSCEETAPQTACLDDALIYVLVATRLRSRCELRVSECRDVEIHISHEHGGFTPPMSSMSCQPHRVGCSLHPAGDRRNSGTRKNNFSIRSPSQLVGGREFIEIMLKSYQMRFHK